jgi:hypothetical protein
MINEEFYNKMMDYGRLFNKLNLHLRGIQHLESSFIPQAIDLGFNPQSYVGYRILSLSKNKKVNEDELYHASRSWSHSPESCLRVVQNNQNSNEKVLIYKATIVGFDLMELISKAILDFDNFSKSIPVTVLTSPDWFQPDMDETQGFKSHLIKFKNRSNSLLNTEEEIISVEVKNIILHKEILED